MLFAAAVVAGIGLTSAGNQGRPLKEQWPWYRSSDELKSQLQELAAGCDGAEVTISQTSRINGAEAAGQQVELDVLHIKKRGGTNLQPGGTKAMFVFGEHARELITGEAALGLVRSLCKQGPSADRASRVLDEGVEFVIVPNANPLSRKKVEEGYYCKRTNEDNVDLNRNWSDEHRDLSQHPGDEMYPGSAGFSEPETQMLREIVDTERPDIYLSVHSGAYLLGMPYGYSRNEMPEKEDEAAMKEVLAPISKKYCRGECPYGNLAGMIHYDNPGCDIDYVYSKLQTPFVFTWEIYVGETFRRRYIEEARQIDGGGDVDSAGFDLDGAQAAGVSLAQRQMAVRRLRRGRHEGKVAAKVKEPEAKQEVTSCMDQFNPKSKEETDEVVETWAAAFLELCEEVSARKKGHSTAAKAATSSSAVPSAVTASDASGASGHQGDAFSALKMWDFMNK